MDIITIVFLLLIFVIYGLLRNKTVVEKVLLKEQPDIIMVNSMTLLGIGGLAQKNGGKPSIERFFPNMVDVTALKRYNLPIGGWVNGRIR